MAYAALVSLKQTIDQILNDDRYPISLPGKQEIISIQNHTTFLQAFLNDFPEKANSLEGRITDVAYKAEDTIEYFMSEKIRLHCGLIKSTVTPSKIKYKRQLRKVAEKIKSIAGEVMDIKNSFRIKEVRLADPPAATSSSGLAPTDQNDMVGFNDDLLAILDRLCGGSSNLRVIPIVGMGGIGKTTLARNAYDHPLTKQNFDIRAWATISQDYSTQDIFSGLLLSMKEFNTERSGRENDSMEVNVYKSLKGRRYLIVMDDMWSTKAWDELKMIFPDDGNGSRIMLTTRLSDVADYTNSCSPTYKMRFMDENQSWNLLRRKVLTDPNWPDRLADIGKKIARSCGGLPLAVVVIAGLLSTVRRTEAAWMEIEKNVNSTITANDEQFSAILSLSYTHLSHHLRPCFLYLGGFPEDYEIRVSKLIKLWIAEGFVKSSGSESLEEAAENYLEDLVKRSLVFVTKRKSNGKIKSCSVHDLVRDLCLIKALEEKFLLCVMGRYTLLEILKNQRRISIGHSDCLAKLYGSTILTIICYQYSQSSVGSFGNFRLLRVLDVVDVDASSFPAQVFELFYLRYLTFYCAKEIPAAISNLQNLQILIINPRQTLINVLPCMVWLPLEVWRMPQLRHLVFSGGLLPNPEVATFALEKLQTLSLATNFVCSERILEIIPNLKKLGICYSEDKYDQDYHLDNLVRLHQLKKLKLMISDSFAFRQKLGPIFPRKLKKLTLSGCRFPWKDMMIVGSLPKLEVLKLRNSGCEGGEWETTGGGFPELKFLLIDDSDLEDWITDSGHFPSLKWLLLHRCWNLIEIPCGIGEIQTLELIEVKDGKESLVKSAKEIQEEQQS